MRFDGKLRIAVIFEILFKAIGQCGELQLLALHESNLWMALIWIVGGIKDALKDDRWYRLNCTGKVNLRCLRRASAADVRCRQGIGTVLVDRASRLPLWNLTDVLRFSLHSLTAVQIHFAERVETDGVGIG